MIAIRNISRAGSAVHDAAEHFTAVLSNVKIMASSVCATANYYARLATSAFAAGITGHFVQAYQGKQALDKIAQHLSGIEDELAKQTSLQVQGSTGEQGFAKHVYWYIRMCIDETEADAVQHCFFVYHPDNDWYPAFHDLVQKERLPPNFCGKSHHLGDLCVWMEAVRAELLASTAHEKDTIFHLLVPAYQHMVILEPLIVPGSLQPLCIEGEVHDGTPYCRFNFPGANAGLLRDIKNLASRLHRYLRADADASRSGRRRGGEMDSQNAMNLTSASS